MPKPRPDASDVVVGRNIRDWRLARQMSQRALGKAIGVTVQQVQKYEKGTPPAGLGRLVLVAQALQVPVAALFNGVPDEGRHGGAVIPGLYARRERLQFSRALALIHDTDVCRNLTLLTESLARFTERGRAQPDLLARQNSSSSRKSDRMPKQ